MCVSLIWSSFFLSKGHSGLTLSVWVGLGVVALRASGNVGVHLGCFPPIESFIYKLLVRKHCLSGIWLVETDLVCIEVFRCGQCNHSRVGLGSLSKMRAAVAGQEMRVAGPEMRVSWKKMQSLI